MQKSLVGMLAVVGTLAVAAPAMSQACIGNPNGALGVFAGGRAATSDGDQRFGVEGGLRIPGGIGVSAGLDIYQGEDGADDVNEFFVRGALETASLGLFVGPRVSACPTLEVRRAEIDEFGSFTRIPVGVGIAAQLSTLIGPSIHGYAVPQVVFSRFSSDSDLVDDETETDLGIRGGAILGFGTFYLGGEVGHVFRDETDPSVTLRAGLKL